MRAFDWIAEQRIQEAQRKGVFDDLPGAGTRLELDDDLLVPAEVRSVYRVLKNAGFVPPEVEARRALAAARVALTNLDPGSLEHQCALRKLHYLDMRLAEQRGTGLGADVAYGTRLLQRFAGE